MNQHVSRPVAQGFPLHHRMNGSIQPAGPRTTTQLLRPSAMTDGRRSLFRSQIPIRIGFRTGRSVPQPSQQTLLHHVQHLFPTPQSSTTAMIRTSTGQQAIESVFQVYEDRFQTDLRDFRAMCCRLMLKEQEEKEKWHTLCLKMMKERDAARQRVSALVSERETHLSSPSTAPAASLASSVTSKRTRDESSSQDNTQELSSRSSPVEPRPIRSLRSSPVPSPPGSPSASLYDSSTAINSSSIPSSSSPPPLSLNTTTSARPSTPCSSTVPPLNITTFNPTRSPSDKTCFDVFGVIDIPESRPVKRRKSYDSSAMENRETKEKNDSEVSPPRPFLIAHTDIMYIPMKGRLFCRACLLDKTTNPSSSSRNPKTFPTDVDWDELRDHCVKEHPIACADVARLCPADLHELRRRLYNNM